MTPEPLEETYFKWLAVHVVNTRLKNPSLTNWYVLQKLFSTEFVWRVRNDDNRVADGKELRSMFLDQHLGLEVDPSWFEQPCSFLEMLIALSERLTFQTEGTSPAEWFWHLLNNVGLCISDQVYSSDRLELYVDQVLQMINMRTYDSNGRGGLFPLQDSGGIDQTKVELWYQMNYYLLERS